MRSLLCLISIFISMNVSGIEKPNFLIIMADDCTYNDLPIYGGKNASTPHLDSLAKKGLTFNQAYMSTAMCQPARAELYTGSYPFSNGCSWNHSGSIPGIRSMPQELGEIGYRVGIAGKVHVKPKSVYPFKMIPGFEPSCVQDQTMAHSTDGIRSFMQKDAPFCLVVCLVEPHVPWTMGDVSQYPPKKLKLPANIADTKLTRESFSRYLAEITYMDSQVGDILKTLKESGKEKDTLVMFTSEQGSQFPGSKWTNWNTGLHTAFIASWPGKIEAGRRTDALIQYADVLPTLLDLAGSKGKQKFDGNSFKDVLIKGKQEHREFAYGSHNNIPEGPAYPIRSITNGKFRYIKNLTSKATYMEKHLMGIRGDGKLNNKYWGTWIWDAHSNPETLKLVERYINRPTEELYLTLDDPYEMNNLADNPEYEKVKLELKSELEEWLKESGDPGIAQDTFEAKNAASRGKHIYKPNK